MDDADLTTGTWLSGDGAQATEVVRVRACTLEVASGPDAGRTQAFAAPVIRIGRADTDFVLQDRRVSGLHAEIALEEGGYRIRDLGSSNGTFVQGVRVIEAYLEPGASFTIGETQIRFMPQPRSVEVPTWAEPRYGNLVGRSPAMRRLFAAIDRIAGTEVTVVITGETGSGKELVAEAIHDHSTRADGPFVVLDCGAVPPHLFDAQLFGHERGAFTDASREATGVFESADGGTLFLDEVGELPLELQPKLLRAVETGTIKRIGGTKPIQCDVRMIAATNRDLAAEINRGAFRLDLYHRLGVVELRVPPLRQRLEDLDLLVAAFAPEGTAMPAEFWEWARGSTWPGNVRQLRNAVARTVALQQFVPDPSGAADTSPAAVDLAIPFREAKQRVVTDFERRYVTALLAAHGGNLAAAARATGVDRMSIYKALRRLGLDGASRSGTED